MEGICKGVIIAMWPVREKSAGEVSVALDKGSVSEDCNEHRVCELETWMMGRGFVLGFEVGSHG